MPNHKPVNYGQAAMISVGIDRQFIPSSFEYAPHYLLAHLVGFSAVEAYYKNDLPGACVYHPKVVCKTVLFAYTREILASRRIEKACRDNADATFTALSAEAKADIATIAAFVSRAQEGVVEGFRELLPMCERGRLFGGEMLAIDGGRFPKQASHLVAKRGRRSQFRSFPRDRSGRAGRAFLRTSRLPKPSPTNRRFFRLQTGPHEQDNEMGISNRNDMAQPG